MVTSHQDLPTYSAGAPRSCVGRRSTSGRESFNYGEGERAESSGDGKCFQEGPRERNKRLISRSAVRLKPQAVWAKPAEDLQPFPPEAAEGSPEGREG